MTIFGNIFGKLFPNAQIGSLPQGGLIQNIFSWLQNPQSNYHAPSMVLPALQRTFPGVTPYATPTTGVPQIIRTIDRSNITGTVFLPNTGPTQ